LATVQAVAPSLGVELVLINLRDPDELGRAIAAFARPASALLVAQSAGAAVHRKLFVALAAKPGYLLSIRAVISSRLAV
jgi:hypothetical protein